jgi:hypothetical protein
MRVNALNQLRMLSSLTLKRNQEKSARRLNHSIIQDTVVKKDYHSAKYYPSTIKSNPNLFLFNSANLTLC